MSTWAIRGPRVVTLWVWYGKRRKHDHSAASVVGTCMWKHLREHDPTMKWIPMAQKWWFCSAIINQFKKTNKNGCVSCKFLQGATWVRKLQRFWWHPTYHAHATRMHPPCQCGGCTFETIDPQHPVHDLHISQDAARFQLSKNAVVPCQGILGEGG